MYCKYCGDKLKEIWNGYYDIKTGEKEIEFDRCPKKDCVHGYHKYKSLKKWWWCGDYQEVCVKCGHIVNVYVIKSWD